MRASRERAAIASGKCGAAEARYAQARGGSGRGEARVHAGAAGARSTLLREAAAVLARQRFFGKMSFPSATIDWKVS